MEAIKCALQNVSACNMCVADLNLLTTHLDLGGVTTTHLDLVGGYSVGQFSWLVAD